MESVIDSSLKKRNAGNKEMDEITFSTDRRFSGLHCEQMETDLKKSATWVFSRMGPFSYTTKDFPRN